MKEYIGWLEVVEEVQSEKKIDKRICSLYKEEIKRRMASVHAHAQNKTHLLC